MATDYCTVAEVQADLKNVTFATDTFPTLATVSAWITSESAYIDGIIGLRYTVPITSTYTNARLIIKQIAVYRVIERYRKVAEIKTGTVEIDSEEKGKFTYTPNHDLQKIAKGLLILEDAPTKDSKLGIGSFAVDEDIEHEFDMGKQQW